MMRLGRFKVGLTCLLLYFPDPRLLMLNLRTVWPNVSRDTTMIAGRLTLFAEMLLEGLYCDDPFFFIIQIICLNINLLKCKWILTVAR
jgi:hypothetical protein